MTKTRWRGAVGGALLLVVGACGSSKSTGSGTKSTTTVSVPAAVGKGEGALNLIVWAGYAESGQNDPKVDWVTPFQTKTGCQVNVKVGNTSDEMVQLMRTGEYDGVSASGDATLRLIAAGDVAAVNPSLVANYADISPFLKMTQYNSKNGVAYGIPHGWGANLLMYNTDVVKPPPDSWGAVFDANSPYKGKITAYDAPIYIADAALYLMKTKPDLKITNPYALDQTQFDAVVALLKTQHTLIGEYWNDYTKAQAAMEQGTTVLGTTWQVIINLAKDDKATVDAVLPKEGSTAWSDTWMIASKAKNPNCMYMWFDWITSPDVQAQVAEWFGEAPANPKACPLITDNPTFCDTFKATDQAFHSQLYYWTTPTEECLDGRTNVKCVPFTEWQKAWTEIKG